MRRSIAYQDHALQPSEYLDQIEAVVDAVAEEKGYDLSQLNEWEPRLEKILQFVLLVSEEVGVADDSSITVIEAVPVDDIAVKPSFSGKIVNTGGKEVKVR